MGSGAAGLHRRERRQPSGGELVARVAGVVRQPSRLDTAALLEGREHRGVELTSPQRAERILDRGAGELVAERERVVAKLEDAGRETGVDRRRGCVDRLGDEPELALPRHHRDEFHHPARRRGELSRPEEHRALHAAWYAVGRREGLRDEERIPAGHVMQVSRRTAGAAREQLDRGLRQRRRLDPRQGRGGQRLERAPHVLAVTQRVGPARDHQATASAGQPPREQGDDVQRRAVRPVKILDHHRRGPRRSELVQECPEKLLAPGSVHQRSGKRATLLARHVVNRSERPSHHERVTHAPQHSKVADAAQHARRERCLADSGLAGDEYDAPRRTSFDDRLLEDRRVGLALQELDAGRIHGRRRRAPIPDRNGNRIITWSDASSRSGIPASCQRADRSLRRRRTLSSMRSSAAAMAASSSSSKPSKTRRRSATVRSKRLVANARPAGVSLSSQLRRSAGSGKRSTWPRSTSASTSRLTLGGSPSTASVRSTWRAGARSEMRASRNHCSGDRPGS